MTPLRCGAAWSLHSCGFEIRDPVHERQARRTGHSGALRPAQGAESRDRADAAGADGLAAEPGTSYVGRRKFDGSTGTGLLLAGATGLGPGWHPMWSRILPGAASRSACRWSSSCASRWPMTGMHSGKRSAGWSVDYGRAFETPSPCVMKCKPQPANLMVTRGDAQADLRTNREKKNSGGRWGEIRACWRPPKFAPPAKPRHGWVFAGRQKSQREAGFWEMVARSFLPNDSLLEPMSNAAGFLIDAVKFSAE